jgi:DNA-binding transcriptional ArsR family regulator
MPVPLVAWLASLAIAGACTPCAPTQTALDAEDPIAQAPELPTPDPEPVDAADADPSIAAEPPQLPRLDLRSLDAALDRLTSAQLDGPGADRSLAETPPPSEHDKPASTSVDPIPPPGSAAEEHTATAPIEHTPRSTSSTPTASADPQPHAHAQAASATPNPIADSPTRQLVALLSAGLAIGLYHKLSKDQALDHPARKRIVELLDDEPGLGTNRLADELDVCYRTALHHLEVLQRFDLVRGDTANGRTRWALPGDAHALEGPEFSDSEASILDLLRDDPGLHLSEIARRTEFSKSTVKHGLERLVEAEHLTDERVGPLRCFFPTDD